MNDPTASLLVDAKGEALISQQNLPDIRVFDNAELTAMCSAMLRTLVTIHGPEFMQLVAIHAEDIEAQLEHVGVVYDGKFTEYTPPPATDEAYEAATAEEEQS